MKRPEDYVLAMLLLRLRNLTAERVRTGQETSTRSGVPLAKVLVQEQVLPAEEISGFEEAARFLLSGDQVRACASCLTQVFAATPGRACPRCAKPLQRGVLASPQAVEIDRALEPRLRRLILDATARARTRDQVGQADRLRREGKIGVRPEQELAPRERSCAESTLGPYRLLELIGRGSSSYVYKAEDSRDGRVLAIKALYPGEGESEAAVREKMARFQREAELASKLDHPGILRIEPLQQAGPWYFFPMTFVDGPSLAQLLEARKAASASATESELRPLLAALVDVAHGLHYAHCRGVVHRDVTPRNILFSSTGQVFLGDFGASKPLDASSQLTAARTVVGTLGYASPERLQSETKADARSDVYSLGVVLYEILTGRLPFLQTTVTSLLAAILREGPPAPRSIDPQVPPALEAVALRALDRDPARRYATALDFAEAIAAALGEDAATPASAAAPAPADDRAARARAFALGASAALLLALLFAFLGEDDAAPPALEAVDHAWRRLTAGGTDPDYDGAREQFFRALAAVEAVPGVDRSTWRFWLARKEWSQGNLAAAQEALAGHPRPRGHAGDARRIRGLSAYFLGQRYGAGKRSFELREIALAEFSAPAGALDPPQQAFARAMVSLLQLDLDGAFAGFQTQAREHPDDPEAVAMQAWTALLGGEPRSARQALEGATERHAHHPLVRLQQLLVHLALEEFDPAFTLAKALRQKWPEMMEAPMLCGQALLRLGHAEEAIRCLDRALTLDPVAPGAHRLRSEAFSARGDRCAAIADLNEALAIEDDSAPTLFGRAQLLLAHGERERARADLRDYVERFPGGASVEDARRLLGGR